MRPFNDTKKYKRQHKKGFRLIFGHVTNIAPGRPLIYFVSENALRQNAFCMHNSIFEFSHANHSFGREERTFIIRSYDHMPGTRNFIEFFIECHCDLQKKAQKWKKWKKRKGFKYFKPRNIYKR